MNTTPRQAAAIHLDEAARWRRDFVRQQQQRSYGIASLFAELRDEAVDLARVTFLRELFDASSYRALAQRLP